MWATKGMLRLTRLAVIQSVISLKKEMFAPELLGAPGVRPVFSE